MNTILPSIKLLEKLIGLRLESVRVSRGGTSFDFAGKTQGDYQNYLLSTMTYVCFDRNDVFQTAPEDDPNISKLWGFLELHLCAVHIEPDEKVLKLEFENDNSIFIWSKHREELFLAKNLLNEEWFVGP